MPFNKAVFQFLDERHDEKMAQVLRDNGLPEDTLPAADERADPPAFLVSMRRASIFDQKWIWKQNMQAAGLLSFFLMGRLINPPKNSGSSIA